jgi:5-formyltetrahydrofolate cyclo-ligase
VDKSEIRKKIFKIRKQNDLKSLSINFNHILNIIDKYKFLNSSVGGYYPYNYEIDVIEILKKFEKKNIKFHYRR